jgi:hypothetical protein
MRRLISFLLGGAVLIGGATLGLRTGTASAADHHDKNYRKHHHKHHRHHHKHKDKLSY